MKAFDMKNLPTFQHTVTLLNRRDGRDSPDHLDAWKKTVLHHCTWVGKQTQNPSSRLSTAAEVNEGASCLVRVPPSGDYRPYNEWKADMEGFTFSPGDGPGKGGAPVRPDGAHGTPAGERYPGADAGFLHGGVPGKGCGGASNGKGYAGLRKAPLRGGMEAGRKGVSTWQTTAR